MGYKYSIQNYDHWLEPWLNQLRFSTGAVLDIGCGPGLDTQLLHARGLAVQACDVSDDAINQSRQLNPTVLHHNADARELTPYADSSFDLVIAALSLHYFDQADTHRAFATVRRILRPGGFFLFRLNAWDDYEFGAPATLLRWQLVETANGRKKQFFTEDMIHEVTAGRFTLSHIEKHLSLRYDKPKSLFECCAQIPAK